MYMRNQWSVTLDECAVSRSTVNTILAGLTGLKERCVIYRKMPNMNCGRVYPAEHRTPLHKIREKKRLIF